VKKNLYSRFDKRNVEEKFCPCGILVCNNRQLVCKDWKVMSKTESLSIIVKSINFLNVGLFGLL
jgi:hypothetical protein